jgi:hypothetical protein
MNSVVGGPTEETSKKVYLFQFGSEMNVISKNAAQEIIQASKDHEAV